VTPHRAEAMPALHPAAYHGPAGQVVRRIAPSTEADPVGMLVTLLAHAGAVVGSGPHVVIGGSEHPARIWPLLIGRTAGGRKGTAEAEVEKFVLSFNSYFLTECSATGLSSGEGLIGHLSPRDKPSTSGRDFESRDKRLLVVEPEFSRTLTAGKRESSTLSPVLRGLWDHGRAAVMTRSEPLSVTGAHVVVVAHVAPRELRLKLSDGDIAGGLFNRFLPVLVERSQLLSHEPATPDYADLTDLFRRRLDQATRVRRVKRTEAAERKWEDIYAGLNDDDYDEGPVAEILARGPVYMLRLALTYALLDGADAIDVPHLEAALAVWRYVVASSRNAFGELSGHSDLDRIAESIASAPAGRTRTELSALFSRNADAQKIDSLVRELIRDGRAAESIEHTAGKVGRPAVRVYWVAAPRDPLAYLLPQGDELNERTNKPPATDWAAPLRSDGVA